MLSKKIHKSFFLSILYILALSLAAKTDLPGASAPAPSLTEKSQAYIDFIEKQKADYQTQAQFIRLADQAVEEISIATYNIGLLWTKMAKVPEYPLRSNNAPKAIRDFFTKHKDNPVSIIHFQEFWFEKDHKVLSKLAKEFGYLSVLNQVKKANPTFDVKSALAVRGLDTWFHESIIDNNVKKSTKFDPYSTKAWFEGSYQRGSFQYGFTTPTGLTFTTLNTHLTPMVFMFGDTNDTRALQVTDLITDVTTLKSDFVLLGADFNISPYYGDQGERTLAGSVKAWLKNSENHPRFFSKSAMFNAYPLVNNGDGYTQDPDTASITAKSSSTKEEPKQILDVTAIKNNSPDKYTFKIASSELIFTEPLSDDDGNVVKAKAGYDLHLSDHYGVLTRFKIYKTK